VESLRAPPVPPAEAAQPPAALPAAPNNGMMEYWIIGIMGIKKDKVRINGLFLF
jgi:hypothetical protein